MILVTGGAGYIGSVLVRELLALGETVRVVDPYWFGDYLPTNDRLDVVREDLRYCDTASVLKDVDAVIHLSGLSNDPTADYSKTKRLAEIELLQIAEQYEHFCPVILRKGTIFGLAPRMRFDLVVNAFVLQAWRNQLIPIWGSGEVWRPFLHIRDAVDAYIHLLWVPTGKIRGEAFNLVHKNYRVLELAHWITEILEQHRGVEAYVKRNRMAGE